MKKYIYILDKNIYKIDYLLSLYFILSFFDLFLSEFLYLLSLFIFIFKLKLKFKL